MRNLVKPELAKFIIENNKVTNFKRTEDNRGLYTFAYPLLEDNKSRFFLELFPDGHAVLECDTLSGIRISNLDL